MIQGNTAPIQGSNGGGRPRCTVGLLTWNAGEDGLRCVESVLAQTERVRLGWLDNASTDGTVERLAGAFEGRLPDPAVATSNIGFCAGHNRMLARCETPYYLALNQDVVLAPDYVRRLCDWLDAEPELALAAGLTLRPPADPARPAADDVVDSAGLIFPRVRYHFHLGAGRPYGEARRSRRRVAGVEGAACVLRVEPCRRASLLPEEIFAESFFAYYEEIDLALRLARLGLACGVDGDAVAVHRGKGSGGLARTAIQARFFVNHWLATLRNEPWGTIAAEMPYLLRGEAQFWLREYLRRPAAALRALGLLVREAGAARGFYRSFERDHGPTRAGLRRYRRQALEDLRAEQR